MMFLCWRSAILGKSIEVDQHRVGEFNFAFDATHRPRCDKRGIGPIGLSIGLLSGVFCRLEFLDESSSVVRDLLT